MRISKALKKPLIWIIIALALIARLSYVLFVPQYPVVGSGSDVTYYDLAAQNILEGKPMPFDKSSTGEVEIIIPPGYPLFLTSAYLAFGNNFASARVMQAMLAALAALFVFLLGANVFKNDNIGYLSAFLYAVYPALLIYTGLLYTETVFTSVLIVSMYILNLAVKEKKIKLFILTGVFLGIASLVSSRIMYLPLLILFSALFIFREKKLVFQWFFYIVCVMVIVISPWTIRNYFVSGGKIIFLESYNQSGTSLWLALNPYGQIDWNTYKQGELVKSVHDELPVEERISVIRKEAKEFLRKYPFNFIKYSPKRFFWLWGSGHSYYVSGLKESLKSLWIGKDYLKVGFKILLLLINLSFISLGFLGIVLNWRNLKDTFAVWVPILYLTALHSFYVTAARLHIPMIPFILIFASASILFLKEKYKCLRRS